MRKPYTGIPKISIPRNAALLPPNPPFKGERVFTIAGRLDTAPIAADRPRSIHVTCGEMHRHARVFFLAPLLPSPLPLSPRSIPLEEIVGRGETRRANRIPDAGTGGNVGYVGRETKLIDAVKRAGAEQRISNHRCTTVPVAPVPKWQWENFRPILGTGRMPIKYRYGCVSVYTVGERIES